MADAAGWSDAEFGLPVSPAAPAPQPAAQAQAPDQGARPLTVKPGPSSAAPQLAGWNDAEFGLAPRDASAAAASGAGPLANTQDDSWLSGGLKGAATGAIKGAGHILGQVGDINNLARLLAAGTLSLGSDKSASQIYQDMKAKEDAAAAKAGWSKYLDPANVFPSSSDVYNPVLKRTGEYQPASELGKVAQAGVEAATGALGPGSGAAKLGDAGRQIVLNTAKQAPLNAVAGAAGQGATDASGNPYLGLAASVAAPGVAEGAGRTAAKVMSPALEDLPVVGKQFAGQREANVGNSILHDAADPQAVKDWASSGVLPKGESDQPLAPGPSATTGAVLGDTGLLGAQRQMRRDDPAGMIQYDQDRNAAARDLATSVADPNAQTMLPSQYMEQAKDNFAKATDLAQQKLAQQAVQAANPLSALPNAEDLGTTLRSKLAALHDQSRALTTQMYGEADPNNVVRADPTPISETIKSIKDSVDPLDSDISPAEAKLYGTWESEAPKLAADTGTIPYKSLIAFDRNLNSVLPDADKGSRYRLNQLKSAVMDTLNNSLDQQHAVEQKAVAAGAMSPEDTLEAHMRAEWNVPYAATARSNVARTGTGAVGFSRSGAAGNSGADGAGLQAAGQLSAPTGDTGIPQAAGEPSTYSAQDAAGKLAAAKQQFIDTTQTYGQGPVGKALATNGYKGQFDTPASALLGQAIKAGPTGYETAKAYLKAGQNSPETVEALKHAALYPLKDALTPDGMVSQKGLAAYKSKYADALRALDEVAPGFSGSFDNAAKATETAVQYGAQREAALKQFQQSAGAKLIGKASPTEAQNEIWGMISDGKNGVGKLRQIMAQTKGNPDVQEGIRGLARDAILARLSNTAESGTSGTKSVSNAKADRLVANNLAQLREIFPRDQIDRLAMLEHQKMLDNREVTAGTIKASAADRARDISHALSGSMRGAAHGAAAGGLGVALFDALKEHGFEHPMLTGLAGASAAALYGLNKLRSHGMAVQDVMRQDAIRNPLLAQKYVTRAMNADQANSAAKIAANAVRRALISAPIVNSASQ